MSLPIRRHCEAMFQVKPEPSHQRDCFVVRQRIFGGLLAMTAMVLFGTTSFAGAETERIRVGHFPNVTHAPALIGRATGQFEKAFQGEAGIEWKIFNAGPEAIEALFAGAIDILYVGPSPAVNGYIRSRGDALRIIAGVTSGGAGFVLREDSGIERFEDIKGKRIATPQKGNTQDVALRHLMKEKGLVSKDQGGAVEIFHISGGDQITAFLKEQVDAIWTVEPWLTRLTSEANGKILFEEGELWPDGQYATAVLVVRRKFMEEHPALVAAWVKAHVELIEWMNASFPKAKRLFNEEFERETGKSLPPDYLDRFFSRIAFTHEPMESSVRESARRAFEIGYLGRNPIDLSHLYELSFLKKETG